MLVGSAELAFPAGEKTTFCRFALQRTPAIVLNYQASAENANHVTKMLF